MTLKADLKNLLLKHFGFNRFRENQFEIIESLVTGNDTMVIMPTGGGKSLCYQISALYMKGVAIIVSPLIALMKNQVDVINALFEKKFVASVFNSTLSTTEKRNVKENILTGQTKLVYISPESFSRENNIKFFKDQTISFVAIDEAHCISEWGHDFRPDYRIISETCDKISANLNKIALTATATPKVKDDIIKNLNLKNHKIFQSSFNRPNLFYEIRKKDSNIDKQIISYIKSNETKSGIIYCMSRKKVDELSELLQINNIKALPYHAGLDSKIRSLNQDHFLMQNCDVIVATIAFGMGIDKPDIRYVIHYDISKSIESYYQETGRAGRDGGEGRCIAFYSYEDIERLEKFLSSKPISEKEQGLSLLEDVSAYCETSMSRRKYLLNYFGEDYDENNGLGNKMDDNSIDIKEKKDIKFNVSKVLSCIKELKENYKLKELANYIAGIETTLIRSHKLFESKLFGFGKSEGVVFWKSVLRKMVVEKLLVKKIESYGILKISDSGHEFINQPYSIMMSIDNDFSIDDKIKIEQIDKSYVIDNVLINILKKERITLSKKHNLPPFAIFQDSSIEEMTHKYPTSIEQLSLINGVGEGKAKKFGESFINLISNHVKENKIEDVQETVIKSTGTNSLTKLFIIQSVDKKLSIDEIASSRKISYKDVLSELETIIFSGTKLDLTYLINEIFDEESIDELSEFFHELKSDSLDLVLKEFSEDYETDDLALFRLYFYSKHAS
ncbi:RecQ family ATP-dependent DNA helicase [Flavobacteriales bacterium]|nr:RecQ family ATP-dependent DNA helicase [Flavobacteriales bacterium]